MDNNNETELELNRLAELRGGEELKKERTSLLGHIVKAPVMIPAGVIAGGIDAVGEVAEESANIGTYGALTLGRGVDWAMGFEYDEASEERIMKQQQEIVKRFTKYLDVPDAEDEPVFNFVKNATAEILKFSSIYKKLGATKLGTTSKAGISLAGAGALISPDEAETIPITDYFSGKALEAIDPKLKQDFDKILSEDTDDFLARELIRKSAVSIDYALAGGIGAGAVKLGGLGAEQVKKGGSFVASKIPKQELDKIKDLYVSGLRQARSLIETKQQKLSKQKLVQKIKYGAAETRFSFDDTVVYDPTKNAWQNINESLSIEFDVTNVVEPEDIPKVIKDYEKKLTQLAPKIEAKVVNLAKAKGISKKAALDDFAAQLGGEGIEYNQKEGLKNVLRMQARNILAEQETMKFGTAYRDFTKGIMNETEFATHTRRFLQVYEERAAEGAAYARGLRTMQDISSRTRDIFKMFKSEDFDNLAKAFDFTTDDKAVSAFGAEVARATGIKKMLNLTDDEFMASMMLSIKDAANPLEGVKKAPLIMQVMSDVPGALGSVTQANLLTGPPTIVLNSLGSVAQQSLLVSEAFLKAGFSTDKTRAFGEAVALTNGVARGYKLATLNTLKSLYEMPVDMAAKSMGANTQSIRSKIADIPHLDKKAAKRLMSLTKEDMSSTSGNKIIDAIHKIPYGGKAITGHWSFGVIGAQDAFHKMPYTYGELNRKMYRAMYVDDAFGVIEDGLDVNKAYGLLQKMHLKGGQSLTKQEVIDSGFDEETAVKLSMRLKSWATQASMESVEAAEASVFQQRLHPTMERIRKIAQDTGGGAGKIFTSFFTTPVNVFSESLKRIPVIPIGDTMGLPIHPKVLGMLDGTPEQQAQAFAMIASGNIIANIGYELAKNGYYQPVPSDGTARGFLRQTTGATPGSFVLDGKSYSSNPLGGIHYGLAAGAGMYQNKIIDSSLHMNQTQQEKVQQLFFSNLANLQNAILESPLAATPDQMGDVIKHLFDSSSEDPSVRERGMKRLVEFLGQRIGNFVPNSSLQRTVSNNVMDSQMRANGFVESIQSQFAPYLLEQKAYDPYGNPYEPSKGWVLRYTNLKTVPTELELLAETGFMPENIYFEQTFKAKNLSKFKNPSVSVNLAEFNVWDEFIEFRSDGLIDKLKAVRETSEYRNAVNMRTNEGYEYANKLLRGVVNSAEREAKEKLLVEYPAMQEIILQKAEDRKLTKGRKKAVATFDIPTVNK